MRAPIIFMVAAAVLGVVQAQAQAQAPEIDAALERLLRIDRSLSQAGGDFGQLVRDRLPAGRIQDAWTKAPEGREVRNVRHDPGQAIRLRIREGAHTMIALPEWERVSSDKIFVGSKEVARLNLTPPNKLILVPGSAGYDGTITVIGDSGIIYAFYIIVENDISKNVPDFIVYVNARQPLDWTPPPYRGDGRNKDFLRELPFRADTAEVAFDMVGAAEIAPASVMSDGVFTYLFYGSKIDRSPLPTVNAVVDGIDQPVNTRRVGQVLVVERGVGEGLTLRHGQKTVCIRRSK